MRTLLYSVLYDECWLPTLCLLYVYSLLRAWCKTSCGWGRARSHQKRTQYLPTLALLGLRVERGVCWRLMLGPRVAARALDGPILEVRGVASPAKDGASDTLLAMEKMPGLRLLALEGRSPPLTRRRSSPK